MSVQTRKTLSTALLWAILGCILFSYCHLQIPWYVGIAFGLLGGASVAVLLWQSRSDSMKRGAIEQFLSYLLACIALVLAGTTDLVYMRFPGAIPFYRAVVALLTGMQLVCTVVSTYEFVISRAL